MSVINALVNLNNTAIHPQSWFARAHHQTGGGVYDQVSVKDANAKMVFKALKANQNTKCAWLVVAGAVSLVVTTLTLSYCSGRALSNKRVLRYVSYLANYYVGCCVGVPLFLYAQKIAENLYTLSLQDPRWEGILNKCIKKGTFSRGLVSAAGVFGIDLTTAANT